ncbi:chaperone modulator CbpM [Zeimonas arvi]|uniref:chaperone modulator CbpM n=1 Tax=Zeimonas arvi TaxID=2498847 RepID=UPI001CED5B41|nr:chaperone modulator CbpM [Zeimonas arvi]
MIDEVTLSVEELARACAVEPQWVVMRVEAGLLGCRRVGSDERRFASAELARARRLAALERDFEANEELAALAADLIEEVQRLREQLRAANRSRE